MGKAGHRGEGAGPLRAGVLAADRAGREPGLAGRRSQTHRGLPSRETHRRRGLTAVGTMGLGGRSPGGGDGGGTRGPAALPTLRASLPPRWRPAGRHRPRGGGGGGGDAGDARATGCFCGEDERHQLTPGRSAELGGTRRRSAPVGPPRLGWGRGSPRPAPAQVASGARRQGFGNGRKLLDVEGSGPYPERMRRSAAGQRYSCRGPAGTGEADNRADAEALSSSRPLCAASWSFLRAT